MNEAERAAAFASQADRSRELAAGYVQQAVTTAATVRALRDNISLVLSQFKIEHRWSGTRLDIKGPDGEWVEGVDLRGPQGATGSGWAMEAAIEEDGERRVVRVVDWFGGAGDKPTTGQYVGVSGFVEDASSAIDVRGATGATGDQGVPGAVESVGVSVPTGFSISNSPVISSGTMVITYASGYQGFTTAQSNKLAAIEAAADVTDTENVTAAGALMDSEVTSLSGIKSLTVQDNVTVSTFGASLVGNTTAGDARGTLGLGSAAAVDTGTSGATIPLLNGANTWGAEQNFADSLLTRPLLKDYGEKVNVIGSIGGGTQDIDLTLGNVVTGTVDTSTTTFTFSDPTATGNACSFTLILTNGGSQTINWPASVDWAGATAPTLTASGVDVLVFTTLDGGTTWYGFAAGIAMA